MDPFGPPRKKFSLEAFINGNGIAMGDVELSYEWRGTFFFAINFTMAQVAPFPNCEIHFLSTIVHVGHSSLRCISSTYHISKGEIS